MSLGNAGSLHDSGIPNLKLNSAMRDLLAGSHQSLTFRQSGCFGPSVSNLCPTQFDSIRFLKPFQRSGAAIRAAVQVVFIVHFGRRRRAAYAATLKRLPHNRMLHQRRVPFLLVS